jgi:hypothetical protein
VFGDKNSYFNDGTSSFNLPQRSLNTVFYLSVMMIVNIILMNLLIAIMAESYARVQKWEELGKRNSVKPNNYKSNLFRTS